MHNISTTVMSPTLPVHTLSSRSFQKQRFSHHDCLSFFLLFPGNRNQMYNCIQEQLCTQINSSNRAETSLVMQLARHAYHPIRRRVEITSTSRSQHKRAALGEEPLWYQICWKLHLSLTIRYTGSCWSPTGPTVKILKKLNAYTVYTIDRPTDAAAHQVFARFARRPVRAWIHHHCVSTCFTEWAVTKSPPQTFLLIMFPIFTRWQSGWDAVIINSFIHHHFLNNLQMLWIGCTLACEISSLSAGKAFTFTRVYTHKRVTYTQTHSHTRILDFPLAVVSLILYTDCIDPYIGGEQGNTACK